MLFKETESFQMRWLGWRDLSFSPQSLPRELASMLTELHCQNVRARISLLLRIIGTYCLRPKLFRKLVDGSRLRMALLTICRFSASVKISPVRRAVPFFKVQKSSLPRSQSLKYIIQNLGISSESGILIILGIYDTKKHKTQFSTQSQLKANTRCSFNYWQRISVLVHRATTLNVCLVFGIFLSLSA